MKLTNTHIYKQNIDAIYTSCMNEDFVKSKMNALGARNIEVSIRKKEDSTIVEIIRETPVEVPNALKSLIQPWVKMTQTEVWKGTEGGPYYCNINIKLHGVPLNIQGQMKLANTEGGTAVVSITDVHCTIPFIGKALTNFIGETSKEAIEKEFAYIGAHVK
jgi:hypothetical protein